METRMRIVQRYSNVFFWLIGPRSQFRVPGPNARTAAMEITPMVSMAAESTDTERAQTIASQLVHCAQHASAVEWMCAGSCACARSKSTLTSKMFCGILCFSGETGPAHPIVCGAYPTGSSCWATFPGQLDSGEHRKLGGY